MAHAIDVLIENEQNQRPWLDLDVPRAVYLLEDQQNLASYYMQCNNWQAAADTCERMIAHWEAVSSIIIPVYWTDMVSAVLYYLGLLCEKKAWPRAIGLLERTSNHPKRFEESFLSCYQYMLQNPETLQRLAYETGNLALVDRLPSNAFVTAGRYGSDGQTSLVRYEWAILFLRLDSSRVHEAIALLEAVLEDEEVLDATNGFYWLKDQAERELARAFFDKTLHARENDKWQDVAVYADKLVRLVTSDIDANGKILFGTRECSKTLAAWDRINGRPRRARQCVRTAVTLGIDMLSDTDPDNDFTAWNYLCDALLAVGDTKGAIATVNMLRQGLLPEPVAEGSEPNDKEGTQGEKASKIDHESITDETDIPARADPGKNEGANGSAPNGEQNVSFPDTNSASTKRVHFSSDAQPAKEASEESIGDNEAIPTDENEKAATACTTEPTASGTVHLRQ
ncbi:hypothetical protein BAUCODRAFT_319350 [Baudoinia panamericana UAMH 10762]|uniref:Uncharacterized protein n=1 Tax=Baudoinia panamericana (strain UAMH 10762) TaxID=717646 RepID=M2LBK4_BAUPA|nr:uncharacterized protein BAUCODRAFT_319350 [Baudoinia panamericana UAMH 10762]EMC91242.1 hypothetical protein BAUCODRAFT_319350 [Baudoinia panamericana UAMH 10762]